MEMPGDLNPSLQRGPSRHLRWSMPEPAPPLVGSPTFPRPFAGFLSPFPGLFTGRIEHLLVPWQFVAELLHAFPSLLSYLLCFFEPLLALFADHIPKTSPVFVRRTSQIPPQLTLRLQEFFPFVVKLLQPFHEGLRHSRATHHIETPYGSTLNRSLPRL
jgi:hypothetical protein